MDVKYRDIDSGTSDNGLRSWQEAVQLYLRDPHAKKMLRRIAYRFLPVATGIAFLDDFLLPGVGLIDDVTMPFLIGGLIVMAFKINSYRYRRAPTAHMS